jgi:hypothetical protein
MASLAASARSPTSNAHQSRRSKELDTTRPSLPGHNASQRSVSDTIHNQNLSITSNPTSQGSQDQVPFPELPDDPHHLYLDDSFAHVLGADGMSTTFADANFVPHFDDFMTPDYSTDNHISEHTTPQEAIWETQFNQQYPSSDSAHPHILDASPPNPSKEIQGIFANPPTDPPKFISGAQLLSPQLTTPSPAGSTGKVAASRDNRAHIEMNRTGKKRGAESLQLSTDASSLNPQNYGPTSSQRPVSPVIMVSSHPQGDSPAHATPPRHMSLSQRRESPLHDSAHENGANGYFGDTVQSRLMPPNYLESADFNEPDERSGLGPAQRGDTEVPTINQMAEKRQVDERNLEVEEWLHNSNSGSEYGEARAMRQIRADRPRAHSTGVKVDAMGIPVYSDRGVPGPGALIDEDSEDAYSDDEDISVLASSDDGSVRPESPPVEQEDLENQNDESSYFPSYEDDSIPPEMQEPLPRQFYRRGPWQDALGGPISHDKSQPFSSNAAMMRFNEEASKWESASRAATWGTRRRLSESEVQSIVDGSRVRHMSLVKRGRARGSTILKKARNKANDLIPRRSNSNIKKAAESPSSPEPVQMVESPQPQNALQRLHSFGKSKSPPLDTASTFSTNAIHGEATSADSTKIKSEGLRSPLQMLRKARSRSDVGKSSTRSSPGLQELMTQHGGPPVMNLSSPSGQPPHSHRRNTSIDATMDEDDDDDADGDETGIKMDLTIRAETIIPNLEGFKCHARQLNPRLQPYLIDRIGQEQVRRYKKLIESRIKHAKAVANHTCGSKNFCFEQGGDAILLTPKPSSKDPEAVRAQFSVQNPADGDIDEEDIEEGTVTPALFPAGIPLPPVKRLPAEFECFLCFKTKKFQKPSDWTKHVHEDVQPFSCTFPNCTEPKSFKRKADWVRHENERHRRLEYWRCSVQDCSHVCYRKDNFVQHLVREHKKTEPKLKNRGRKNKVSASAQAEDDEVWNLVAMCRHETHARPRDEPCKFCGNVLSSWKKLSVHMGKHMEQIAMPVLELVSMKEVNATTIISPIEQNQQKAFQMKSAGPRHGLRGPMRQPLQTGDPNSFAVMATHMSVSPALSHHDPSLSPYPHSMHSHPNSSAGHSPALGQIQPQMSQFDYNNQYYVSHGMQAPVQNSMTQSEAYVSSEAYGPTGYPMTAQYGGLDTQAGPNYSSGHTMQTPLSAQSMPSTLASADGANYGNHDQSYSQSAVVGSFQQYPPSSQHNGNFHPDTNQINTDPNFGMSNQYGQQPHMYYQR